VFEVGRLAGLGLIQSSGPDTGAVLGQVLQTAASIEGPAQHRVPDAHGRRRLTR